MPTISIFYGIVILMRQKGKEHNPPHIHALYAGHLASYEIKTGNRLTGKLPKRAEQMVKEFLTIHKEELLSMWESGNYRKLQGLE